ncbi:MAG: phosphatase PAP2 family protein [Bacteroidota bacterium]|nr:phosphatase PAP2 family protein [Bacteroidota bacterium]
MIETLNQIDTEFFLWLNSFHNRFWDSIMFYSTNTITWLPFYLILIFFIFKKHSWQLGLFILLLITLIISASDQGSVHLFKNIFERLRPCHNQELVGLIHQVNGKCGGLFGFISSHASNTFAIAIFISLLFRKKWVWSGMILWASFISYTRIYLGVHYPGDILAGALWGTLLAFGFYQIYIKVGRRYFGIFTNA